MKEFKKYYACTKGKDRSQARETYRRIWFIQRKPKIQFIPARETTERESKKDRAVLRRFKQWRKHETAINEEENEWLQVPYKKRAKAEISNISSNTATIPASPNTYAKLEADDDDESNDEETSPTKEHRPTASNGAGATEPTQLNSNKHERRRL